MKMYQIIVRNEKGIAIQRSDPHTWAECEKLYTEYKADYENELGHMDIIYIGKI